MARFGSMTWLERTGGKLAWFERLRLIAQGVQAKHVAKQRRKKGGKLRNIEVDEIFPPESAITREAMALCQDASEPYLFNHCLRAYFWARLLDDGQRGFDDEAVFTSMLLHDMGLTETYRLHGQEQQCFSYVGAKMAHTLAIKHQWQERRATLMADAIALHLNIAVGAAHSKEAQMVRVGSVADVAGLGLDGLEKDQIQTVIQRIPRLDLAQKILPPLQLEMIERPCCRIAFLQSQLGFTELVRHTRAFHA